MAKQKNRRDPIADYVEWTEHRYDPGHYLGGNLPPDLRKSSLSPKGRRYSGAMLLLGGAMGLVMTIAWASEIGGEALVMAAFYSLLSLVAGFVMFRSAGKPKRLSKTRPR
jgi:hypothetical protein